MAGDRRARLQRMAAEATDPEDKAWAISAYEQEFGEKPYVGEGPRRDQFVPTDPLLRAIRTRREAPPREQTSQGAAALLHGAQGGSFGLSDELTGAAVAALDAGQGLRTMPGALGLLGAGLSRVRNAFDPEGAVAPQPPMEAYRAGRDSAREDLDQTAEDHPVTALGATVAGSLLNPIRAPLPRGTTAMGRIASAGGQGALQGAAQGLGVSRADLTRGDFIGAARDTGGGAALGGALGVAGQSVGEGVKKVGQHITDNVRRRAVGELAEGMESATTPTQRKHLDRAQEDIWNEMTTGPDAQTVRNVRYQGATEGREALKPVLERIGQENAEHYAKFTAAGRANVDAADYMQRLANRAAEADEAGDTELFNAINNFIEDVDGAYQRTGSLPLQRLRGMTTQTQRAAASAIGGLNGHAPAELKARLTAVATEAMDDSLSAAAAGDPALEAAADAIRANNRRYYANKTIDKNLALRETKENTGPGLLVRGAKAAATPGALAAGAAIAGGDENRVENALAGAGAGLALRGLVPAAKLAQRKITDFGIASQMPGYGGPTATGVSRAVRPFVPGLLNALMSRREQDK